MAVRIIEGDALAVLRTLESESVQVCVTSPPYFGLRSYGTTPQVWGGDPEHDHEWGTVPSPGSRTSDTKPGPLQHAGNTGRERLTSDLCDCGAWRGELGLEPIPAMFIAHLVEIFREIRRVLRSDGLVFCNLSDSYSNDAKWGGSSGGKHVTALHGQTGIGRQKRQTNVPAKSLFLIPQRFAIAMQDDGWIVRSQIVWAKAACMPESVRDRPTSAWEPIWMFAKSRTYFWDQEAVRQPAVSADRPQPTPEMKQRRPNDTPWHDNRYAAGATGHGVNTAGANIRNVWTLGPEPLREQHYASFPTEIPKRCILAGTSEKGQCPACGAPWVRVVERTSPPDLGRGKQSWTNGATPNPQRDNNGGLHPIPPKTLGWRQSCPCPPADPVPQVVLDPFSGAGTTLLVASRLGRNGIGIELNPEYARLSEARIKRDVGPMFPDEVETTQVSVESVQRSMFDEAVAG